MSGSFPGGNLTALFRDVAHLLASAALLLSFLLLGARRMTVMVRLYALQGIVLAAAAAWQGMTRESPSLYLTAALILIAKGGLIPVALNRIVLGDGTPVPARGVLGPVSRGLGGIGLVVLCVLVSSSAAIAAPLARDDLGLALAVVLLGLAMTITGRGGPTQAMGFLSMENGVVLAVVGVSGLPLVAALSAASPLLPGSLVFGLFLLGARDRAENSELSHLDLAPGSGQ